MRRILLSILLFVSTLNVSAQSFNLKIAFESMHRESVTLSIYDGDSVPRIIHHNTNKNNVSFTGKVKTPCYAEVSFSKAHKLGFFIENSNITIQFNESEPELSTVTGSRINSLFRYALEQCTHGEGNYNTDLLVEEVKKNKGAVYAPYIIYRYILPVSGKAKTAELTQILEGDATKGYHYQLLSKQISNKSPVIIGRRLPDIVFEDARHNKQHTDSLIIDRYYNLIIVGASWCKQCQYAKEEAVRQNKTINTIVINIDDDKKGWDSDVIQKLQIEHIPYLILISPDGTVREKDLRAWEIRKKMKSK